MFKNNKSLLQRARIAMLAIVTILGISGAFAMKAPEHKQASTYGVVRATVGGWIVTSAAGDCDLNLPQTCKVESEQAPDENGFIPNAAVMETQPGAFIQ
ncbi:hypothetical protein [Mucilaginibacter sp. PAMB04168]|uniref:hypothetical protein n=1 Tax=Mucilaginibacter sp. PAMB04168 TaxID=3138567 RepID=UPI0031F69B62